MTIDGIIYGKMTFEEFIEEWRSDNDHITAHTSGSTGNPKTITLDKEFVRRSALRTNSFFRITSASRLHSCVAPDFIGGKMMAVRALEAGCRLTWETPSNRPLADAGAAGRIDLLAVVPSQTLHILDNMEKLPEIRAMLVGGSAIDPSLRRRIAGSGINAYESYGMTETASHIALRRIEAEEGWFETLGGIMVATDTRGCLEIWFPSGERFVTNDLAATDGNSRFRICGRYDHIIITGGKKVNPFEVERKIAGMIDAPFVVTSEPDVKWGRRIVLRIERAAGSTPDELPELLSKGLREALLPWEMPKEIEIVNKLERTPNGKLKR